MANKKHKVEIEFEEHESSLQCGLRQSWCSGKRGKGKNLEEVDLTVGAGVGNPWMIFSKTKGGGKTRCLILDVRKLVPLLDKLLT